MICLELWTMVSNSKPRAVTSVNKEFGVFLQTENIALLEVTRRSVTFSQKSNDCSTCTWRGMMASSLLMPGGAWGHIFSQPRNMYKAANCEIFREKNPKHFSCWNVTAGQLRTEDTWIQALWCRSNATPVGMRVWFMVANYWLESGNFSEGKDESPEPFIS